MKIIQYKMNVGTAENPCLVPASMTYSDINLEIVKKEAYEGKYEIIEKTEEQSEE